MTHSDLFEIVHIDDNRGDLALTQAAIEDCCPDVHYRGISNPDEGMAYLAQCAGHGLPPPSLVLLDLNMPRVHGQEIIRFIKDLEGLRHLPVVVLTTSTRSSEIQECRRLGADDVLVKPADYESLVELVRVVLHQFVP